MLMTKKEDGTFEKFEYVPYWAEIHDPSDPEVYYISGKYSSDDYEGIEKNIAAARKIAIELAEQGKYVFTPHLNTAHFEVDCKAGYDFYIKMDLEILTRCDIIVMIPGWEESKGAKIEKEFAEKNNIFVVYYFTEIQ